jgi:FtsH-binding integral membrane protein
MKDDFLATVEWEYNTLRSEIQECYKYSFQIFSWGTGLLLTFIGLVIQYGVPEMLVLVMIVSIVLDVIWIGQMVRINRAGQYLRFTEAKVNAYLANSTPNWETLSADVQNTVGELDNNFGYDFSKPLYWETWLAKQRNKSATMGHLNWLYLIQAGVFPGVFLVCPYIYIFKKEFSAPWYIVWYALWTLICIILVRLYFWVGKKLGLA